MYINAVCVCLHIIYMLCIYLVFKTDPKLYYKCLDDTHYNIKIIISISIISLSIVCIYIRFLVPTKKRSFCRLYMVPGPFIIHHIIIVIYLYYIVCLSIYTRMHPPIRDYRSYNTYIYRCMQMVAHRRRRR